MQQLRAKIAEYHVAPSGRSKRDLIAQLTQLQAGGAQATNVADARPDVQKQADLDASVRPLGKADYVVAVSNRPVEGAGRCKRLSLIALLAGAGCAALAVCVRALGSRRDL